MIKIINKTTCCGCTACVSVCSKNAILMQPDDLGFFYPVVDVEKCNDCGLCETVCAFNPDYSKKENLETPIAYAVRHKDMKEIETSRSGAMFIAVSDWVLQNGGVVYGAGYVEHFRVAHKRATTREDRDEFKGSKYVQSDMNTVFRQVKVDLKAELKVLFSGTPCQTSGLRASLLNTNTENLYVCDIVCHGVPSPHFWQDYLAFIEKKQKDTAIKIDFRDKARFGWGAHKESFTFTDTYTYTYTYTFYKHIMFRHSCGVCPFTNLQRPSDITLADFWGWRKIDKKFNADNKGVSLVLVNTERGKSLFDTIKGNINYIEVKDLADCMQPQLQRPTIIHSQRGDFESDYKKYGFDYVVKKYCRESFTIRVKKKIKQMIKRIIRK
jgi:coenzyme F420-reducing hydrogenase beta subunit